MSITPYQYQLLNQSFSLIRPNFSSFSTSLLNQLKRTSCYMSLPEGMAQKVLWETAFCDFLQEALSRVPQQTSLVDYVCEQRTIMRKIGITTTDLSIITDSLMATLSVHLHRHFTLATRNAWRRLIRIICNIISSEHFGVDNVVCLNQFKEQQLIHSKRQ